MKFILLAIFVLSYYPYAFAQQTFDCKYSTAFEFLDVNSVRARINQGGDLWWDQENNGFYEVPKTDGKYADKIVVFNAALWMGGIDDSGTLRVAANSYRQSGIDFWPGPLDNEATDQLTCSNFDRISNVHKTEVNNFLARGIITDNLKYYPAKNNPHLQEAYGQALPKDQDYAPFVDVNDDGIYNVEDGDYPKIKGDQSLYWIINDLGNKHTETNGNPIGVEVKNTAYAYKDASSILDTVTFYRFDITNMSRNNYTDFVFGMRVNTNLGYFNDDFIGVDTVDNFMFMYNGDDFDESARGYGENIPIVAIAMLNVPYLTLENQTKLGTFMHFGNDFSDIGSPTNWMHYYKYMNAQWQNGQHITYGANGTESNSKPTHFMFPSNPSDNSENAWSECSVPNHPGHRRTVFCSKPFNLPKGAAVSFEYAVITSFDVQYPCPDISNFKKTVRFVQDFYDLMIADTPTSVNWQLLPPSEVQLFPNPAKDVIQIVSDYTFKSAALFTVEGVEVINLPSIKQNKLLLNKHLTKNIFLLKLQTENGIIFTQKLQIK